MAVIRSAILVFLIAALGLAQEKNTSKHVQHFSRPVFAGGQIGRNEVPHIYAAREVRVLGDLEYGQTSEPVMYSAKPPYSAFVFSAFGGETVEVTVRGADRKAMVALADASLQQLAIGDTRLRLSLPYRGPYIECWYIVFRDFEKKPARFTVQVKKLGRVAAQNSTETIAAQ